MHLAWRWFTGLSFDQEIPHHSTFSKNRHGRFQESKLFEQLFEQIVRQCGSSPWWSYAKRPLAEILCDVFAAELLLPHDLFKPEAERAVIGLAAIEDLAARFQASLTATGSRYAAVVSTPLAFVLSEQGKVRYASRSSALQEAAAWIPPRLDLPDGCLSKKAREGTPCDGRVEVDATYGSATGSAAVRSWRKCDMSRNGIKRSRCCGLRMRRFLPVRPEAIARNSRRVVTTKTKNFSPNWMGICAGLESTVGGRWLQCGIQPSHGFPCSPRYYRS